MKRVFSFQLSVISLLMAVVGCMGVKADTWRNYEYNSSEGTEFYVTFLHNNAQITSTTKMFQLFMATRQMTHVSIYRDGNSQALVASFYLNGDTVWRYQNTSEVYLDQSDAVFNSVRVVTDEPITLYTSNSDSYIGDASFVLPSNRLGKEYVVQTPGDFNVGASEFAVIATQDGTTVQITPSYDIPRGSGSTWTAGTTYSVSLNKGQVYYATSTDYAGSLSGTKICANKSVALFNACQSSKLVGGISTQSHLYHQAVPLTMYGTRFAVSNIANTAKNIVMVTAAYDGTKVYVNGALKTTLSKCQTYKHTMANNAASAYLNTSKPCIAYQYLPGNQGSPAMGLLSSLDQAVHSLKLTTFKYADTLTTYAYVNLVLADSAVAGMMLDSTNISSQFSSVTGLPGYSCATVPMSEGEHELLNPLGRFNALAYAISDEYSDTVISYVFNAGMNCANTTANFLLDGEPTDSIAVCEDVDNKGRFTATSLISGDYQSVRWYDEYNHTMTLKSSDSIWNAEIQGVGLHTVWMWVTRTTPVCNNQVTDKVYADVRVNPRYDNVELPVQQVCQDQRIKVWDDSINCDTLPEEVVLSYPKTFQTIYGCDSTVIARIKKTYPRGSTSRVDICQGGSHTFHGRQYDTAGTYTVLDSVGSCTYTDTLVLTVNPVYLFEEADTICSNDSFVWHGKTISKTPGTQVYYDYLTTSKGCDSTFKLTLTVNPAYFIVDTVDKCDNDLPYRWHGRDLNQSGVYWDSLTTAKGCDSTHKLVFTVHPTFFHVDSTTICGNDSALWRGRWFKNLSAGQHIFFDSLLTQRGCDSVYKLVINVYPSYSFVENQAICDYDTFAWRGKQIHKAAGVYVVYDSLKTGRQCDSVYVLNLTVNPSYSVTTEQTICQGETYQFDQHDWTWRNSVVGHHDTTVHYSTAAGCDSSFRLLLTVNEVYHSDLYDTVCNNHTYHWTHGAIDTLIHETVAGVYQYEHHFKSVYLCDSAFTLHLTVKDTAYVPTVANIPDYGSVTWDGKVYAGEKYAGTADLRLPVRNKPYTYTKKYNRVNGCDSLISLTVKVDSSYQRTLVRTTCRGVDYDFNGTQWSWRKDEVGVHDTTYSYQTVLGYDSSWTLQLTVNEVYFFTEADSVCVNEDYIWQNHGKSWFAGQLAVGTHQLYDSLTSSRGCDSVYQLTLTVLDTFGLYTTASIPDMGSYTWDGKIYAGEKYTGPHDSVLQVRSEPYVFRHGYKSQYGCDSVLQLTIQVDSSYQKSKSITICQHDTYDFNGTPWTWMKDVVGTHDTLYEYKSVQGYDSTWHLILTVNPVYFFADTDEMCVNGVYDWAGHNRQISGLDTGVHIIYDSLLTGEMCDSVYELTLTVKDTILVPTVTGIPDNGSFSWNGRVYAGEKYSGAADVVLPVRDDNPYFFRDTLVRANGCDSFRTLTIQVDSSYQKTRRITICQHDTYDFNGTPWTWMKDVAGVHDTLYEHKSVLGYDSTWHLILTVNPVYFFAETDEMCINGTLVWHGKTFNDGNVVLGDNVIYDSLKSTNGCDSVYQLTLTVKDTIYVPTVTGIPDNGSMVWNGKRYAGEKYAGTADTVLPVRDDDPYIFRDTLTRVNGCDSFLMLSLQVDSSYQKVRRISICRGDDYDFNGQVWTWKKDEVGVHDTTYRFQSVLGYDSTWQLILTVNEVYSFAESDVVCTNDTLLWHGMEIVRQPGDYVIYDSLKTIHGCDSVYRLNLEVRDTVLVPTVTAIPDNGSFTWNGRVYGGVKYVGHKDVELPVRDEPYFFRDTMIRVNGCDSFRTLTIQVDSSYQKSRDITICQHDTYLFNGQVWTWRKDVVGVHDTLLQYQSVLGYDSSWHVTLTVNPVYLIPNSDTTCVNVPYNWRGSAYSGFAPGVHIVYDSLQTDKGCDSVYELTLTVIDTTVTPVDTAICDNRMLGWLGMTIAGDKYRGVADTVVTAGVHKFRKVLVSSLTGCDSMIYLTLTVIGTFEDSSSVSTPQYHNYTLNGTDWTWMKDVPGVHDTTYVFKDSQGLDSVWHLHLTVHPAYIFRETDQMCRNEAFSWRGLHWDTKLPGTYVVYDSLKSIYGADSVYELTLTVNDTVEYVHYLSICDNDTVTWDGEHIRGDKAVDTTGSGSANSLQGVYQAREYPYLIRHNYKTLLTQCDSVETLWLTVYPTYEFHEDTALCARDGFMWRGRRLTTNGTHCDSFKTIHGCDSVYSITLNMDLKTVTQQNVILCEGDSFSYRGRKVGEGVYYDTLNSSKGCDSVIMIVVSELPYYYFRQSATICQGDVYQWHGQSLTNAGVHFDHQRTQSGCDSTYELTLTVIPEFHDVAYDTVCLKVGDNYHWRGKEFGASGVYYDSIRTAKGCDSVYEMRLTLWREYIINDYIEICEGDSFDFRGRTVKKTGVYYDSLLTRSGCDSIYKLVFNVTRTYHINDTAQICDGETYVWRGRSLTAAGTYRDSLQTVSGCDSIYELYLIAHPHFLSIEYDTVCSNTVYYWRGMSITSGGTYYDGMKSRWGCDSVYELRLTMYHETVTEQYVEICQGESFDFRGRELTVSGVYYDTLTSVGGCDSILKLVFNVTSTYYFRDTTEICDGESYAWRGRSLTQAGTYRDSLGTVKSGCDSIYELFVIMHPKHHYIEYDTVCSNGTYQWRGKALTQSGTYFDSLRSVWGCDSVYEMRLTMNAPYIVERRVNICQGQSFSFRGEILSAAGTYYDTLVSSHGCDSIVKLIINIMPTYYYRDTTDICDGDTLTWRGMRMANAGSYRDTLLTVSGCDSIYELYLIVHPRFHHIEYDTVCSQSVYNWRGMAITESGNYYDRMKSRWGCDSVYELRLTMNMPYLVERRVSICQGQSFSFRGGVVSTAGTYYDTLVSSHGCDSIVKLILNIMPTYYYRDTTEICDGEALSWRGRALTHAGTYRDSLLSAEGCDSIYEMYLIVNPKYHYIAYDTVCSQSVYDWRGKNLTQSGVYFDSLKSHLGCDSVYELRLTMNMPYLVERRVSICQGQSFSFRGGVVSAAGTYYDTLISSHGCDSIVKLILNIMPTYHYRDSARICDGSVYMWHGKRLSSTGTYYDSLRSAEGCDSIYELYLTVSPAYHYVEYDTVCTAEPYLWRGKYLSGGGVYYDSLRTPFGCDSVYELRLVLGVPTVTEYYIEVCQGQSFNFRGRAVTQNGVYYDTLVSKHGCDSVFKLVFNITPVYHFWDTAQICGGSVYTWRGKRLSVAGVYFDSLKTMSGCDSIYELYLKVNPTFLDVDYDTVCTNNPYHWRGKWLTQSGTYYDSLKSKAGCDSVYMIYLTINRPHIEVEYREICQGTQTTFRNRILTQDGVYDDTLKTTQGCDSIYRLVLNVRRTVMMDDTVHTCAGTQYNFRGRLLGRSGIYYDTVMYGACRDSIFRLDLIVDSTYHYVASDTVCGGTYRWHGKTLTRSGVYYDSLKTQWCCDSVYELRLTVDSVRIRYEYDTICHGGTWWLNGRAITQAGVYCDTLPRGPKQCDSIVRRQLTVLPERVVMENTRHICLGDTVIFHGDVCTHEGMQVHVSAGVYPQCDTIYKMYLDVDTPFHQIDSMTICSNENATFRGRIVNTAGVYFDTMTDQWGCDSIYELRLNVKQASYALFNVDICHNQVFTSPTGKIWNTQGVHNDTLVNRQGCDSILTYNLNVLSQVLYQDTLAICRGGSGVAYNGLTYSAPGTYRDTVNRTPANGCDTVFTTYVYYDTIFEPINKTLCAGDVFTLWGKSYRTPGTYTQFVTSRVAGTCDTLFNITITVNQPTDTLLYAATCDNQPYWFRGNLLTQSGTYKDTTQGVSGCDSVIVLRLTVQDSLIHDTEYQTICEDTVYEWIDGNKYSKDGTYYYNPINQATGCTEYYTLVIHTIKKTQLTGVNDVTICQDDEEYYLTPTFTGPAPTEYSISYGGAAVDVSGSMDSSFIALPVPKMPDGKRVKPDSYTVTLQVGNEGCGLSTLSKDFTLVVKYPSAVLEQHFNDVVSVLNYKYNDIYDDTHSNGYTFDAYRWYLNGRLLPGESKSNLYRTTMKQGDRVYAELRRSGEANFVPTCEIVIENFGIDSGYPVVIYRTSLPQTSRTTKMKASEAATYKVCAVSGVVMQSGNIDKNEEIELELPYVAGCYFLVVDAETAGRKIFKIVVH